MDELEFPKKLIELGDREGARKELALFLRTNPNNVDAWFLLAQVVDDNEKKADCYRQIIRLDTDNKLAKLELQKLVAQRLALQTKTTPVTSNFVLTQPTQIISQSSLITTNKSQILNLPTPLALILITWGLVIISFFPLGSLNIIISVAILICGILLFISKNKGGKTNGIIILALWIITFFLGLIRGFGN